MGAYRMSNDQDNYDDILFDDDSYDKSSTSNGTNLRTGCTVVKGKLKIPIAIAAVVLAPTVSTVIPYTTLTPLQNELTILGFSRRRVGIVAPMVASAAISGVRVAVFNNNSSGGESPNMSVVVTMAKTVLLDDDGTAEVVTKEVDQVSPVSDFPTLSPLLT